MESAAPHALVLLGSGLTIVTLVLAVVAKASKAKERASAGEETPEPVPGNPSTAK